MESYNKSTVLNEQINEHYPILEKWVEAINNHDLDGVCNLYSHDAIFLPPLSDYIRNTPLLIKAYFVDIFKKEGLKVKVLKSNSQIKQDIKINTGEFLLT